MQTFKWQNHEMSKDPYSDPPKKARNHQKSTLNKQQIYQLKSSHKEEMSKIDRLRHIYAHFVHSGKRGAHILEAKRQSVIY